MASVLIIDDDPVVCDILLNIINDMGHSVTCSHTLSGGLHEVATGKHDLILLDVGLPDGNGLDAIALIQETEPAPQIIIITASGDKNGAELAIRNGAWDYIQKPASVHDMTLPIIRAIQYREERKVKWRGGGAPRLLKLDGIVGNCSKMKGSFELVAQAANVETNVLITGETGTGKELFASAIHNNSLRAKKPFVVVDCSVLPETLVESILFGYEKGAFTGAQKAREGLIKQADGGTLFLDEVAELPFLVQKAFLRVLQEHRFRPVGSSAEISSDFRLIAATNRDLQKMVHEGTFRTDFLFRLTSFTIELPPLRDRAEDIADIASYYVAKLCERHGIGLKGFSPDFMGALSAYKWPGNVRELLHAVERALAAAFHEPTLFPQHLPEHIRIDLAKYSIKSTVPPRTKADDSDLISRRAMPSFRNYRENMDRMYLMELTSLAGGNIREACGVSGLSRSRLYDLLKKHNLTNSTLINS
ncbi:MAG: sigma-54 dependent transcriptional regulator [Syntrophobacteraceae bacterium]|jgi:two-component system NtrC family response regulator